MRLEWMELFLCAVFSMEEEAVHAHGRWWMKELPDGWHSGGACSLRLQLRYSEAAKCAQAQESGSRPEGLGQHPLVSGSLVRPGYGKGHGQIGHW
jgi:hypothetical protein